VEGEVIKSTIEPQIGGAYIIYYEIKQSDGKIVKAPESQLSTTLKQ
jgi:hypothetical protein